MRPRPWCSTTSRASIARRDLSRYPREVKFRPLTVDGEAFEWFQAEATRLDARNGEILNPDSNEKATVIVTRRAGSAAPGWPYHWQEARPPEEADVAEIIRRHPEKLSGKDEPKFAARQHAMQLRAGWYKLPRAYGSNAGKKSAVTHRRSKTRATSKKSPRKPSSPHMPWAPSAHTKNAARKSETSERPSKETRSRVTRSSWVPAHASVVFPVFRSGTRVALRSVR